MYNMLYDKSNMVDKSHSMYHIYYSNSLKNGLPEDPIKATISKKCSYQIRYHLRKYDCITPALVTCYALLATSLILDWNQETAAHLQTPSWQGIRLHPTNAWSSHWKAGDMLQHPMTFTNATMIILESMPLQDGVLWHVTACHRK